MTEVEKLRAGLPYDFTDAEVDALKLHAVEMCQKLNQILQLLFIYNHKTS